MVQDDRWGRRWRVVGRAPGGGGDRWWGVLGRAPGGGGRGMYTPFWG